MDKVPEEKENKGLTPEEAKTLALLEKAIAESMAVLERCRVEREELDRWKEAESEKKKKSNDIEIEKAENEKPLQDVETEAVKAMQAEIAQSLQSFREYIERKRKSDKEALPKPKHGEEQVYTDKIKEIDERYNKALKYYEEERPVERSTKKWHYVVEPIGEKLGQIRDALHPILEKVPGSNYEIADLYVKAKVYGSNSELVKVVEEILTHDIEKKRGLELFRWSGVNIPFSEFKSFYKEYGVDFSKQWPKGGLFGDNSKVTKEKYNKHQHLVFDKINAKYDAELEQLEKGGRE